jgi:hypothetical protein
MRQGQNILRWISVIPGAVLAGVLATFPWHWILEINTLNADFIDLSPRAFEVLERTTYPGVVAFAYVMVGCAIAPSHKLKTAIGLSALYLVFAASFLFYLASTGAKLDVGLRAIGPIVGLALGLLIVRHNGMVPEQPLEKHI